MNLQVWLVKPKNPVPIERSQETQSKLAIGLNPMPAAKHTITDVRPIDQFRYQETTASWNFFIFRIEIDPFAVKNGFAKRHPYRTYFIVELT